MTTNPFGDLGTYPGSVANGTIDTEYTPMSAQEQWFRACDKRVSALEVQVHRLLNADDEMPSDLTAAYMKGFADGKAAVTRTEGDYAHVPGAEWEALKEELEALRAQQAQAPDVPMLQRMIDALHNSGGESIEEIVRLSSELSELRAFKASVPWPALCESISAGATHYPGLQQDIDTAISWFTANAPKLEAAE